MQRQADGEKLARDFLKSAETRRVLINCRAAPADSLSLFLLLFRHFEFDVYEKGREGALLEAFTQIASYVCAVPHPFGQPSDSVHFQLFQAP